jgi:fatty-acyl-CoA synthase
MRSTMGDGALTTTSILRQAERVFAGTRVGTYDGEEVHHRPLAGIAADARRLASGLAELGVRPDDRVATLCWNHSRHLATYYAVPGLGAVLHTLNLRLAAEQIRDIVRHAGDTVLLVDARLAPMLEPVAEELARQLRQVIVLDDELPDPPPVEIPFEATFGFDEVLAAGAADFEFPEVDERSAAILCYTTGTTGAPKGVAYSHRSTWLQSLAVCSGNAYGLSERDNALLAVPMFHANAWSLPFACWQVGAEMLLVQEFLQGDHLAKLIESERISFGAGVPTVLDDVLRAALAEGRDLGSVRMLICGGSSVPPVLIERWAEQGVELLQGWGMTETNPLCAIAKPPRGTPPAEEMRWRSRTGRPIHGVELRIADEDGAELPWDDEAVGEIQVRGPWVTAAYFEDPAPEKFADGWLRTGDVGRVDAAGFVQITDRTKDVIKSGGEWISSIDLENTVMAHPTVREAAVVGVPDERWGERPLVYLVLEDGATLDVEALRAHVGAAMPRWCVPDPARWRTIAEVPKTSVGKFDKKALRAMSKEVEA